MMEEKITYQFKLNDLNSAFGGSYSEQRKKDREERFIKGKFREWRIDGEKIVLTDSTLQNIITSPSGIQDLVMWGERLGTVYKSLQLTKSQIRNIFGSVRQIEMKLRVDQTEVDRNHEVRQIMLLKPRLAYQAGRHKAVKNISSVLSPAIDYIDTDLENFQRFVDFFEAILAYHTASGGN